MSEDENAAQPMIQLSGLWKQESKSGKGYYSGNLGPNIQLQLWPNKYKQEGDKRPDLLLYIVKKEVKKRPPDEPRESEDPGGDEVPF